jgi:hypothetical protein
MPAAKTYEAMEGLTFGADPELFVIDPKGEFVSAEGLIPGTKDQPYKVEYGAVQVDGVAAEFNIDPVTNFKDFKRNMLAVQKQLKAMLPSGYDLVCTPTAKFTPEAWAKVPEKSKVLGCSPDYNAWTKSVNPPPNGTEGVRHAGGHIHIGWTQGAETDDSDYVRSCLDLVRQLDWYLGLWSVTQDSDSLRRQAYGKAGAMRFKPYGVEYRTLSNFWLKDEKSMLAAWNRLQRAINDMAETFFPVTYPSFNKTVIQTIDESMYSSILFSEFRFPILKV